MNLVKKYVCSDGKNTKSIAWLSFQKDGSVSCGLSDKYFTIVPIDTKHFLFNYYNRITLEFKQGLTEINAISIDKPHLTFHPLAYFHLTDDKGAERWVGWSEPDLVVLADAKYEWIKLITRPIKDLPEYTSRVKDNEVEVIIPNVSFDKSVGLGIDFINDGELDKYKNVIDVVDWSGRKFVIYHEEFSPQNPSLIWYYQC